MKGGTDNLLLGAYKADYLNARAIQKQMATRAIRYTSLSFGTQPDKLKKEGLVLSPRVSVERSLSREVDKKSLDLTNLNNGVYMLKINMKNGEIFTKKRSKNKLLLLLPRHKFKPTLLLINVLAFFIAIICTHYAHLG